MTKKKSIIMLLCGILGCICFRCGDWLLKEMINFSLYIEWLSCCYRI